MKLEVKKADYCTSGVIVDSVTYQALVQAGQIIETDKGKSYLSVNVSPGVRETAASAILLTGLSRYHLSFTEIHGERNVTVCLVEDHGRTLVGHAICSPKDEYGYWTGRAIAFLRAIGEDVPSILL